METRFVPDAPGAWLVYDLGTLVLALPPEFRAAADAVAASPRSGVADVIGALRLSGVADGASFALLDATVEGVHVALRGPATVAIGTDTLTGLGAEPWLERRLTDVTVVRLTVPGGEWTFARNGVPARRPHPVATEDDTVVAVPGPPPLLDARQEITEVPRPEEPVPAAEDSTVVVDEIAQQFQDLCLQHDIERGRRFVGDEQLRLQRAGDGDHHALTLAARQFVRIAREREFFRRQPDPVEHFSRLCFRI